jgi:hypothetical protein
VAAPSRRNQAETNVKTLIQTPIPAPTTAKQQPPLKPKPKKQLAPKTKSGAQYQTKQDRVVAMLRRANGMSVAAVMKATGWQKHSVHGFFAGVVRKKLGLNLVPAETEGKRVYRIVGGKSGKTATKSGKRVSATSGPVRKRTAA